MSFVRIALIAATILLGVGCKHHDDSIYTMSDFQFVEQVNQELFYQQQLHQALQNLADVKLLNLGARRQDGIDRYYRELKMATPNISWPSPVLSVYHQNQLRVLAESGMGYQERLFDMLMETDETMIAFHVKAIGQGGLQNANLRIWADNKIIDLQQNLRETQALKP